MYCSGVEFSLDTKVLVLVGTVYRYIHVCVHVCSTKYMYLVTGVYYY